MDLNSIDYNTIVQKYMNNSSNGTENNMFLFYFINILLFGSVIIFIFVFIKRFIQSYKSEIQKNNNTNIEENINNSNSMKKNYIENSSIDFNTFKKNLAKEKIICDICGESNDSDSKFCKNCGNKLFRY